MKLLIPYKFRYLGFLGWFVSVKNEAFHQHTNGDILTFLDSLQVSKMKFFFSNKFRYLHVFWWFVSISGDISSYFVWDQKSFLTLVKRQKI